jgi:hypothetical protein
MENWKKIVLKAAAFGAGFAVVAAIFLGVTLWWSGRPPKPKPWDSKSITATFITAKSYGGADSYFEFEYGLKNNTDGDYRLPEKLTVMSKNGSDTLQEVAAPWTPVNVFVPSHQTIDYKLTISYKSLFGDRTPDPDRAKEIDFLNQQMQNSKGYVIFDEVNRYEIDFPSGFSKQSK